MSNDAYGSLIDHLIHGKKMPEQWNQSLARERRVGRRIALCPSRRRPARGAKSKKENLRMKRILCSLSLFLVLPLFAAGNKDANIIKAKKDKIPNSYIVVLEPRTDNVDAVVNEMANAHFARVKHLYKAALKGFAAEMTEGHAAALAHDPRVKYVE